MGSSDALGQKTSDIKILVTAPEGYSLRFQNEFKKTPFTPIAKPVIETTLEEDMVGVDSLLINLSRYDYVAFSSRKAIESFCSTLEKYPAVKGSLSKVKYCSIGKDTEYLKEKLRITSTIHPDEPSPMGIVYKLGEDKNIKGQSIAVLVPRVEVIEEPDVVPQFIDGLQKIGMNVHRVDAYVTKPADQNINEAIELISSHKVDCVAFTSSAEIEVLLLKNPSILDHVTIACFGPYTAAFARKRGLKVSVVSKDFGSFKGFVEAIGMYYNEENID